MNFGYKYFMKKFKNKINLDENIIKFIPKDALFLDIETTGFSSVYNRIYMIGMLAYEDGEYYVTQLLTEGKDDEKELLSAFAKLIRPRQTLFSFNGDQFDLRFISARIEKYNIENTISDKTSFDFLKYIRAEGFLLDIPEKKLKELEKYLGIYRDDIYNGGELIQKYYDYENGNLDQESILLLHNYEDIINMPSLFKFMDIIDERNTINLKENIFKVESLVMSKNILKIHGKSSLSNAYYNQGDKGELRVKDTSFEFRVILKNGNYDDKIKCMYVELDNVEISCKYDITAPNNLLLFKYDKKELPLNVMEYFKYFLDLNL